MIPESINILDISLSGLFKIAWLRLQLARLLWSSYRDTLCWSPGPVLGTNLSHERRLVMNGCWLIESGNGSNIIDEFSLGMVEWIQFDVSGGLLLECFKVAVSCTSNWSLWVFEWMSGLVTRQISESLIHLYIMVIFAKGKNSGVW